MPHIMRVGLSAVIVLAFALGTSHAACFSMEKSGQNIYRVTCSRYSHNPDENFTITDMRREHETKKGLDYLQDRDKGYPFQAVFRGKVFEGYTKNGLAAKMCRCK